MVIAIFFAQIIIYLGFLYMLQMKWMLQNNISNTKMSSMGFQMVL